MLSQLVAQGYTSVQGCGCEATPLVQIGRLGKKIIEAALPADSQVTSRSSGKLIVHGRVDGKKGVPVHLLRGTYEISMSETDLYFAENAKLDLSQAV